MQENKQEKSPIKQRILLFLAHKGVSPYEFYKNSGVTRGVLAQNNGISEDNLSRFISYFPSVNLVWLISGQGEMEINSNSEVIGCAAGLDDRREILNSSAPNFIVADFIATIKSQAEEIGRLKERNAQLIREKQELENELNRGISPK